MRLDAKFGIFPKELVRGFGWKFEVFPSSLAQTAPGKCVCRYSKNKKIPLRLWKQEFKKGTEKIAIFPKGLVLGFGKKPEISPCFYFSQNRPENVIDDIIERKKPF